MSSPDYEPTEILDPDIPGQMRIVVPEQDTGKRTSILWSETSGIAAVRRALQERRMLRAAEQSRTTRAVGEDIRNSRLMMPLFEIEDIETAATD